MRSGLKNKRASDIAFYKGIQLVIHFYTVIFIYLFHEPIHFYNVFFLLKAQRKYIFKIK